MNSDRILAAETDGYFGTAIALATARRRLTPDRRGYTKLRPERAAEKLAAIFLETAIAFLRRKLATILFENKLLRI